MIRRWVRRGFLVWAVVSLSWLANSVRTQGVADELLRDGGSVRVVEDAIGLRFLPDRPVGSALIFICGAGIHPHAYAPLLRPVADAGYTVFVLGLPYRFAPLGRHKTQVVEAVRALMADSEEVSSWVVAGHSLGGALAARVALSAPSQRAAYVLIGTTHPRDDDLSGFDASFTKVFATNDGVAPVDRVLANRALLPRDTRWVRVNGGNHSQFGHYGRQLFDGRATISRAAQQAATRAALLDGLEGTDE